MNTAELKQSSLFENNDMQSTGFRYVNGNTMKTNTGNLLD